MARSPARARTCSFQPESVSTAARRTKPARRNTLIRQRPMQNKAPAIHSDIKAGVQRVLQGRLGAEMGRTTAGLAFCAGVIDDITGEASLGISVASIAD